MTPDPGPKEKRKILPESTPLPPPSTKQVVASAVDVLDAKPNLSVGARDALNQRSYDVITQKARKIAVIKHFVPMGFENRNKPSFSL